MFTPTLRCECAQPASDRLMRKWCIVSNKRPGGVAIFQKGDVYKRQVFNAKMQCLSLFTMTRHREI